MAKELRRWSEKEKEFLINNYKRYTSKELVDKLGRTHDSIRRMKYALRLKGGKRDVTYYAIYKGDEFVFLGTMLEIEEKLGVPKNTLYRWVRKSYHEYLEENNKLDTNMLAIKVEDD